MARRVLMGLLAAGLVGLLGVLWPSGAGAVFSGSNGLLVYDAPGPNGQVGIWTANPDGSNAREVASEANAADVQPAVSPEGRRIAFVNGSGHIAVMDIDGQNLVDLTPNDAPGGVVDASPTWSPDGSKIAFARVNFNSPSPENDIWVMSSNGSGQVNLTPGTGVDSLQPAWSPSGGKIAFVRGNPEEIWTMDTTGANQTTISNVAFDATDPSWSPDSSRLVFSHMGTDLWLIDANGSNQTQLTNNSEVHSKASTFSPDGGEILTHGEDANTSVSSLYLVNPATGAETKIPHTTGGDNPDWQPLQPQTALATTGAALDVSSTSASVLGTVDGFGESDFYFFQYGPGSTGKYNFKTAVTAAFAAQGPTMEAADLTGLTPGTVYHYRIVAQSSQGAVLAAGLNRTFTSASSGSGSEGSVPSVQIGTLTVVGQTIPVQSAALSTVVHLQQGHQGQTSTTEIKLGTSGVLTSGGLAVINDLVTGQHGSATLKLFGPGTTTAHVTIALSQVYPTTVEVSSTALQNELSAGFVVRGSSPTVRVTARDAVTSSILRTEKRRRRISYRKLARLLRAFRQAARGRAGRLAGGAAGQALSVRLGSSTAALSTFHFGLVHPFDARLGRYTAQLRKPSIVLTFPTVGAVSQALARTASGRTISKLTVLLPAVPGRSSADVTLHGAGATADEINASGETISLAAQSLTMTGVQSAF